jgi:hypothetical protein
MYLIKRNGAVCECESLDILWNLPFIQDIIWATNILNIEDLRHKLDKGKKFKISDNIIVWKRNIKSEENTYAD